MGLGGAGHSTGSAGAEVVVESVAFGVDELDEQPAAIATTAAPTTAQVHWRFRMRFLPVPRAACSHGGRPRRGQRNAAVAIAVSSVPR
jgi:hypothetical protein